ncbi:IGR protein motif-domain-containing protein [Schizophyllum commune]
MSVLAGLRSCRQLRPNAFSAAAQRLTVRNASTFVSERPTVPPPTPGMNSPQTFLKSIGRSLETKLEIEEWEKFWEMSGRDLRAAGLPVKDRRYILWCMEKYRQGVSPSEIAHDPKPKKTIRGWGPKVQNGKRIRSRRLKNQKK